MKEFKGTPGPRVVDAADVGAEFNIDSADGGTSVGITSQIFRDKDNEIRRVNTQLIVAAPELLSALQEVIKSLEITLRVGYERIIDLGGECDSPEVMIKGHFEIARAKAAIAKALGE